jgi:hypothetical protein
MSFFRSAALRRVLYALVIVIALVRLATRLHSEPFFHDGPGPAGSIAHVIG